MSLIDYEKLLEEARKDGVVKIVVGAIIENDNKILLLQRPEDDFMGGIFELPSGNLEEGETIEEGLKREVYEETGLRIKSINSYLGHFDYLSGSGKKTRQFNFLISTEETEPIRLTEHDSFVWVEPEKASDYEITESVKTIINNYQEITMNSD